MKRFIVGFIFCFTLFVFGTFLAFRNQNGSRTQRSVGFPRAFWVEDQKQSRFYRGALALDVAVVLYCSWRFGRYFQRRGVVESTDAEGDPEVANPEIKPA